MKVVVQIYIKYNQHQAGGELQSTHKYRLQTGSLINNKADCHW